MITNQVQYRATKAHLAKFEEAIANLGKEPIRAEMTVVIPSA